MATEVILPKVDMDMATGRISRWLVPDGAAVKQGDPLFEIDSPEVAQAQTDLIAAVQGVEKARSQLALARRVYDRQSSLLAGRATRATSGITSPARRTMTSSRRQRSLRRISSSLCRVALETVTPPTKMG